MSLEDILGRVREQVTEFEGSPQLNFKDVIRENWRAKTDVFKHAGVYVIYEKRRPIYVGEAGKGGHTLNYRIGDLFFYSPKAKKPFHHTLTEKLLTKVKRFSSIKKTRDFYFSCTFKVVKADSFQQARTLEAVLVELLKPVYND
jgi:hypothetical protein